jgi:hypothetical protein
LIFLEGKGMEGVGPRMGMRIWGAARVLDGGGNGGGGGECVDGSGVMDGQVSVRELLSATRDEDEGGVDLDFDGV